MLVSVSSSDLKLRSAYPVLVTYSALPNQCCNAKVWTPWPAPPRSIWSPSAWCCTSTESRSWSITLTSWSLVPRKHKDYSSLHKAWDGFKMSVSLCSLNLRRGCPVPVTYSNCSRAKWSGYNGSGTDPVRKTWQVLLLNHPENDIVRDWMVRFRSK